MIKIISKSSIQMRKGKKQKKRKKIKFKKKIKKKMKFINSIIVMNFK
jgi:hypothetical protein